ncbi:uncharacterized protein TNCV_598191 [Trichonephila clavipes]|nr:uncharacterized protein TNCV_598191 [Trichonephila clavipes]
MSPNTLRVHTEYVLAKSVGSKVLWAESRVQGTGEYFPSVTCRNCGGGDRWCSIYHPFEEFRRDKSYCQPYGAQGLGQRQAYFKPLATMNFMGLVLTTSDRRH